MKWFQHILFLVWAAAFVCSLLPALGALVVLLVIALLTKATAMAIILGALLVAGALFRATNGFRVQI